MSRSEQANLFAVAVFKDEINQILGTDLPCADVYQSQGLEKHMYKSKHADCIPYLENIRDVIENPDYVGVNPKVQNSVELIKVYDKNILVAVKLDADKDYLYVASVYNISESKLERRIFSGRLKKFHHGA